VTTEPGQRYEIRFQPAARRAIAQRLPEAVAAAVLEFCDAALAVNPQWVGKPLFGPLAGVTAPGAAPTESSTGSTRTAASFTSSTLTTARRFTAARNRDRRYSVAASLIMPNTCPNGGNHDRIPSYLPRSAALTRAAGRLDS